ncbi:MAG: DNA adenine methylase [Ignavibacteria bacterium]|jgi:DNA adenine methylase
MKKLIAFNYYGGKFRHLDWILEKLPHTKSYLEPFGGSGVVMLNKKPTQIECLNDKNDKIGNFFEVIRTKEDEFLRSVYLTPYSRREYLKCFKSLNEGDNLDRARKFFVVCSQSFNGSTVRQTGFKMSTIESRANISESVNRWLAKLISLKPIIQRMKTVQLTDYDFRVVIPKFDSDKTLIYADPPYLLSKRYYRDKYDNVFEYEMDDADHEELLEILLNCKSKIAISGYDNDLYNDKLKDYYKSVGPPKRTSTMHSKKQEVLWTNYDPNNIHQLSLLSLKTE